MSRCRVCCTLKKGLSSFTTTDCRRPGDSCFQIRQPSHRVSCAITECPGLESSWNSNLVFHPFLFGGRGTTDLTPVAENWHPCVARGETLRKKPEDLCPDKSWTTTPNDIKMTWVHLAETEKCFSTPHVRFTFTHFPHLLSSPLCFFLRISPTNVFFVVVCLFVFWECERNQTFCFHQEPSTVCSST